MPSKKPLPKQRKGKGLGSPRSAGPDGDGSEHTSDDENTSTSANILPARAPTINPLVLHGAEEVLQLADNIADTEDFCHRLVEDLVEMVQDCMIASHVDRIAVPWTVQDIIGQLYAGMHFCIAERDCAASSAIGPALSPTKEEGEGINHTYSGGIVGDRTRQYFNESIEEPLGAQQVLSIPHTPMTEDLQANKNTSRAVSEKMPRQYYDASSPIRRNASRLPLFHNAYVGNSGIFNSADHYGEKRWVDYKASIEEPNHIPADSWSRGVIAVRKRLFANGSNVINASAMSATFSRPPTGMDNIMGTSNTTRRRPSTSMGSTSAAGRVPSTSKVSAKRPLSSASGGPPAEGETSTRPSTGKQLSGVKVARSPSNMANLVAPSASPTPLPRKAKPVTSSTVTSAATTPPPASLTGDGAESATLELLQRGDEGLKEEDKKIIAQDRHAREQMARLKASSAELSRQLGELKASSNFIVDARIGKVIPQSRTDKMEPIEGSISYAQSIANAPVPPPTHINSGSIPGNVPIKISTEGGTFDDAAERAAAALEAANLTGISSIGGRTSPPRLGSPTPQSRPKVPKQKKLPPSAYFAVETRISNPMIASQVVPVGGVSSKEGDSILTAELPQPPVIAGVRPMSRQEFIKVQKENVATTQLGGNASSTILGNDESFGAGSKQGNQLLGGSIPGGESSSTNAQTHINNVAVAAVHERPQSTPPDIGAATLANSIKRGADAKAASEKPSSLLKRFGGIQSANGAQGNASGADTTSFHNYRNTGNASLPPRPASTHQPLANRVRKDVFVPPASKLSQQGDFDQPQLATLQSRAGTPNATTVVPTRKHFKPIFDEKGNVRPALDGHHGDSAAASGALKYVLSKKSNQQDRPNSNSGGAIIRPQSSGGLGGFEAIDVTGSGADLMDGNSRPISRGTW